MTDRFPLGITVGASRSVAVATAADGGAPVAVIQRPTTVEVAPGLVVEGFLARVGDPVRMLADDGSSHAAADLVAAATTQLITDIAGETGVGAKAVACHPGWWPAAEVRAVRDALDAAGATEVELVAEPLAVVRRYEIERGLLDDGALVVYDLGASGLTVSVVRTGEQAGLLGIPAHSDAIAGSEFDLLTMRYVLSHALGDSEFDPFDPAVEAELALLRERCRVAKEELSFDTATVVAAGAFGGGQVRVVRGEFEELVREDVRDSLELVRTAVRQSGIEFGDVRAVLLAGGGGAIPLVAEMVSAEFGLPVVACADPATASAAGGAELAADLLADESSAGAEEHGSTAIGAFAYSDYRPEEGVRLFGESPLAGVATGESPVAGAPTGNTLDSGDFTGENAATGHHDADEHAATGRHGADAGQRIDSMTTGPATEKHSAVSLFAADRTGAEVTSLPHVDARPPKRVTGKRLAVVAAAVAAFGVLTAGTLAVSPQFTQNSPASAEAATNTGAPVVNSVTPIVAVDANGKEVVGTPTVDAEGEPVAGAPLLDAAGQPIPGTVTPVAAETTQNPVQAKATESAGGAAPGAPQGETPQPPATQEQQPPGGGAPAQENTPAPQQPSPAPVQSPSPAPSPTTTQPSAPAPQQPKYPNLGQVPGKIIDGAGEVVEGTVGGVTKLPGELLGGGN